MKMNKIKKIALTFLKWIISNTVWTIITLIIPFTLLIPAIKGIMQKTYQISAIVIILIILFCFIEVFVLFGIIYTKKHYKEKEEKINYNSLDYYFESYHKHLTVYKNGNGILINSFTVIINDINAIGEFKRVIDISDAKISTKFPTLNNMINAKLSGRFVKFGFWYKCLNNKDLIKSVREFYWSDNSKEIDTVSQSNPKILKWIMEMNPSSIEIGKPYNIVYVISIPGMFPIENGLFSEECANIKGTCGKFNSQFRVKHIMKKFVYTVSFENGLIPKIKPNGHILYGSEKKNLHYRNDNNIIYDKYIFSADKPKFDSLINIEWCFKNKKVKGTNNHNNNRRN